MKKMRATLADLHRGAGGGLNYFLFLNIVLYIWLMNDSWWGIAVGIIWAISVAAYGASRFYFGAAYGIGTLQAELLDEITDVDEYRRWQSD